MCATSMPIRCIKRDVKTSSGSESRSFSTHPFLSTNHLANGVSHVVPLLWWLHVSFQHVASFGSRATLSLLLSFHRAVVHHFINVLMHIIVLVELVLDGPLDCIPHRRHRQVRRRGSGPILSISFSRHFPISFGIASLSRPSLIVYLNILRCTLRAKIWNLLIASFVHGQFSAPCVTQLYTRHGLRLVDMRISSHRSVKFS